MSGRADKWLHCDESQCIRGLNWKVEEIRTIQISTNYWFDKGMAERINFMTWMKNNNSNGKQRRVLKLLAFLNKPETRMTFGEGHKSMSFTSYSCDFDLLGILSWSFAQSSHLDMLYKKQTWRRYMNIFIVVSIW